MGGFSSSTVAEIDDRLKRHREKEAINKIENFVVISYEDLPANLALHSLLSNCRACKNFISYLKTEIDSDSAAIIEDIFLHSYESDALVNQNDHNSRQYNTNHTRLSFNQTATRNIPFRNNYFSNSIFVDALTNNKKFFDLSAKALQGFLISTYYKHWRKEENEAVKSISKRASLLYSTLPEIASFDDSMILSNPIYPAEATLGTLSDTNIPMVTNETVLMTDDQHIQAITNKIRGYRKQSTKTTVGVTIDDNNSSSDEEGTSIYSRSIDNTSSQQEMLSTQLIAYSVNGNIAARPYLHRHGLVRSNVNTTEEALLHIDPLETSIILKADPWLFSFINAIENFPMAISIATASKERFGFPLIYMNHYFETLTGYDRLDKIGEKCNFLQNSRCTEKDAIDTLQYALKHAEPTVVSLRNYRKDGTYFRNMVAIKPILDINGEYRYVIGIHLDITHNNNINFHETSMRLNTLLNTLPSILWNTDIL